MCPTPTHRQFVRFALADSTDPSFNPSRVILRIGSSLTDLTDRVVLELDAPQGWAVLQAAQDLHACVFQLEITDNAQDGRDTRLSQVELYAPAPTLNSPSGPS